MTYQVGDVVVIQSNITYSGEVVPLIGESGTVSQQMQIGQDEGGNPTYRYDILLEEPAVVASGTGTLTNVWMTQNEIDGVSFSLTIDTDTTNANWQTAIIDSQNAAYSVNNILGNVKQETKYYENINNLYQGIVEVNTSLGSINYSSMSDDDKKNNANTVNRASDSLGFDAKVKQELSENLYGVYTVVDEVETELQTRAAQEAEQARQAQIDDNLNLQAYQTTYIDNEIAQNLFMPQPVPATPLPEDDLSNINPDMLLTENTELEG